MTLIWLVVWFIANLSGAHEPLELDPSTPGRRR
jgi:hypothetical protein